MVHVPASARVTVEPDIVQTLEFEANVTGRPEEAVAVSLNGAVPSALLTRAGKVIVWLAAVTVKSWSTGKAAP
jgi:hypothetical protein